MKSRLAIDFSDIFCPPLISSFRAVSTSLLLLLGVRTDKVPRPQQDSAVLLRRHTPERFLFRYTSQSLQRFADARERHSLLASSHWHSDLPARFDIHPAADFVDQLA